MSTTPLPGQERVLQRMTDVIRHRGPDDDGFFFDDYAALGHRRLSIIDVAGGHQPMANETRRRWIVYNGEIFNHAGLRPKLEQAGHRYSTRSDTETILHAYEQYGASCVEHLRGMFAFAIWDQDARTLFCARDRLGKKPFYYFWNGRVFAFASEIKALLEHPSISAHLEEELLPELLGFGYVSEERTLFRGIRKLMPGHHLSLSLGPGDPRLRIEPYWDVPVPPPSAEGPGESEWIAETRRRLEETVQMRLMSDVPLGMFLSGGVDSSAIAAIIRRQTTGPVKTFAVGYREAQFSELGYAAAVAKAIGTEHHEIVIGMEDLFNALPRLIWHEDEPLVWPSSVSLAFVSKLASEQVKVVLTGEGSDEMFAGYERYRITLLNQKAASAYGVLPESWRRKIRNGIATAPLLQAGLRRKLAHTFLGRETSLESLLLDNFYCAFSPEDQNRLLNSPAAAVYGNYLEYWNKHPKATPLARMLYADQKTYLVELLMKQDQMSMSASIESRVPFLDHEFVEFAMHIPDRLKIRRGVQKWILKKAVEDLLPKEIVYRKKMGFPTPIRQWLQDDRAEPLYAALRAKDGFVAAYLELKEVERLIERHRSGVEDATDRIWRLINLQLWGDLFLTGRKDRWIDGILPVKSASLTSTAREAASSLV
ncbi:MAG: asparagine synthase (glutamine-hydrolyzing) [Acidobacteriaceae bacterium]|nr:asparagine synthase (glutamine-hydrolyzing) [Acidobacteriaceae bacterium]